MLPCCYVVANVSMGEIIPTNFSQRETAERTAKTCHERTGDVYTVFQIRESVLVRTTPTREVCSNMLKTGSPSNDTGVYTPE